MNLLLTTLCLCRCPAVDYKKGIEYVQANFDCEVVMVGDTGRYVPSNVICTSVYLTDISNGDVLSRIRHVILCLAACVSKTVKIPWSELVPTRIERFGPKWAWVSIWNPSSAIYVILL